MNQTPISLEKDSTISDAGKSKETLSEGSSDEEEGGTQNERNKRKMYRKREWVVGLRELVVALIFV